MSAEISIAITLSATKSGASVSGSVSTTQDMAGSDMSNYTQLFSVTPEILNLGDVDTPAAYVFVKNMESEGVNVILSLQSDGSDVISEIKPGKAVLIAPATGQNVYISASTGTARAQVVAMEL